MVCIVCGGDTRVVNSRAQKRNNEIWRRRRCQTCQNVFTTQEAPDYTSVWLVKGSAGAVRPFSRDQLFLSLFRACEHRRHPVADAAGLTDTIINKLRGQTKDGSLNAAEVVQTALVALHRFDKTAAVVYQAFHPVR